MPAIDPDLDHVVLKALRKEPSAVHRCGRPVGRSAAISRRPACVGNRRQPAVSRAEVRAAPPVGVAAVAALVMTVSAVDVDTVAGPRRRARARPGRAAVPRRATLATSVLGELHDAVTGWLAPPARGSCCCGATEDLDGLSREAGEDAGSGGSSRTGIAGWHRSRARSACRTWETGRRRSRATARLSRSCNPWPTRPVSQATV